MSEQQQFQQGDRVKVTMNLTVGDPESARVDRGTVYPWIVEYWAELDHIDVELIERPKPPREPGLYLCELRGGRAVTGVAGIPDDVFERAVKAAAKHVPTRGMSVASGVTCECGYWTGSEKPGVTRPVGVRSGSDGLDWHRATVMLAEVEAPIKARALREYADATRHPWKVFRRDDGSPVTVNDLMRETADRIEAGDDL